MNKMKWKSTKIYGYPEDGFGEYLVFVESGNKFQLMATWEKRHDQDEYQFYNDGAMLPIHDMVTHWMELPNEPGKEDKDLEIILYMKSDEKEGVMFLDNEDVDEFALKVFKETRPTTGDWTAQVRSVIWE